MIRHSGDLQQCPQQNKAIQNPRLGAIHGSNLRRICGTHKSEDGIRVPAEEALDGRSSLSTTAMTTRTPSRMELSSSYPHVWPDSPETKPMLIGPRNP
jgi:hypothetical protein